MSADTPICPPLIYIQPYIIIQMSTASDDFILGYWDIRGLAAPIRMTFHYGSVPFRDELYSLLPQQDGRWRSTWPTKAKALLGADESAFPNLPYLVVPASAATGTPVYVMQSNAILRYAGRLCKIAGATDVDVLRVDELLEQTTDMRNELTRLAYGPDFAEKRESFCRESLPYYLGAFERYLAGKKKLLPEETSAVFFVGQSPTIADFAVFDAVEVAAALMQPLGSLEGPYPEVVRHQQTIRALPLLASYFESPSYKMPFNNKTAAWGGEPCQ